MSQRPAVPVPAVFHFEDSHDIRTLTIDGEPWFVVKDICDVLAINDARQAAERLDEDDRCLIPVTDSLGREQQTYIANESGLYCLILRSKKPEAKKFKRWVTSEVLPAIRKHGCYQPAGNETVIVTNNPAHCHHRPLTFAGQRLDALEYQGTIWLSAVQVAPYIDNLTVKELKAEHAAKNWCDVTLRSPAGKPIKHTMIRAVHLLRLAGVSDHPDAKRFCTWLKKVDATVTPVLPCAPPPLQSGHLPVATAKRIDSALQLLLGGEASREVLQQLYGCYLTPREIGVILGINEYRVNLLLFDGGYQTSGNHGYQITPFGQRYACVLPLDGYWDDHSPKELIKWHNSIVPLLVNQRPKSKRGPLRKHDIFPRPLEVCADTALKAITSQLQSLERGEQQQLSCGIYNLIAQQLADRLGR